MKKIATYLAGIALSVAAFSGVAYAHFSIFHHGANFSALSAAQVGDISHNAVGTFNLNTTQARWVIASLSHTISTNGMSVRVNGRHSGAQTTTCTTALYDGAGNFISSSAGSSSANNTTFSLFLTPAMSGNLNGVAGSVMCFIPANQNGTLFGYETLVN